LVNAHARIASRFFPQSRIDRDAGADRCIGWMVFRLANVHIMLEIVSRGHHLLSERRTLRQSRGNSERRPLARHLGKLGSYRTIGSKHVEELVEAQGSTAGPGAVVPSFQFSDQYAPFHTKVINVSVRDATHVLDGLLYQESDLGIEEHYTDTSGFTDHVFALRQPRPSPLPKTPGSHCAQGDVKNPRPRPSSL
jgi:hypothetical protein